MPPEPPRLFHRLHKDAPPRVSSNDRPRAPATSVLAPGSFPKNPSAALILRAMTRSHARGHAASLHQSALLHAAQRGDRRAQEELLRRYDPLIRAIVAKLRLPRCCERHDIAQEARIGLLRAIRAWRPARGPFCPFAVTCVRDRAFNAIDTAGAHKHQLLSQADSLHSIIVRPAPPSDTGETTWESPLHEQLAEARPLADPVATLLANERLNEMRAALPTLTPKERAALTGTLNGKSQQQLAGEQDSTKKAVHRALRRARDKLAPRDQTLAA